VIQNGVNPSLHMEYKQFDRKQYFKEGRGLRTCGLSADSIPRVVQPTVTADGKKAPGLKFGTPRVVALFLALTMFQHLIHGFRNRDLRPPVAALPSVGPDGYRASPMTYDLRRLLRKGFIYRVESTNRYFLTPYGWKVARLFARLEARVFRPAMAAFGQQTTGYHRRC
jgi:hypothetical protein